MTVSAQTPINRSTGNGVTTVFPYTFKIISDADIEVTVDDVVKTLNVDYTVSGAGVDAGGNVTMTTAPATATTVVRRRNMAIVRTTDYQDQGALPAATLDTDIDSAVLMIQQLDERLDRTFSLPASSSADSVMPAPTAGYVLGWDALGESLTNLPGTVGSSLIDLSASSGSSLIGFLPAGIGAVATTVQAKQRESVSVNDYGANPSATAAVNAAAIQAAIDENPVVFLPAGAHNINATITIPDGHTFFGISEYASILVQTGDCDGITNANVTTGGKNILVENIGIHLGTAPSANSRVGLYLAGSSYSKYHNIHCKFFETSVWLNRPIPGVAAWFNSFENIRGEVCKYGVKSYSATNSINSNWFNNITITDTGGFSGGYGLWVNGYGNSFSNLYLAVSSGVAGVYVDTVAGANVFKNIYVESAPTHTIWNNSGTIRVNTFIGVYSDGVPAVITDTAGNGIFISSDDVRLGNTVEVGSFHSVYSDGTLTVKVSDNTEGMKVTASAANSRTNLTIENTGTAGAAWKLQTSGSGFYGSDAGALRLLHNGVHKFTFSSSFALNPATTNTQDLGKSTLLWANAYVTTAYVTTLRPGAGTVKWTSGSGSPEGVLTAVIGSLYTRTDGGAGTTLYVKESGISNTGWIAK